MSRETFDQAITFYLDAVSLISPDQWETAGLGIWNVRELIGHASRAMTTVEQFATADAGRSGIGSADDMAERGREAAQSTGPGCPGNRPL